MSKISIVAALFACLQFSAHASTTQARVMVVKGDVTTLAPDATQETPAVRDAEIPVGSTIGTADSSSVLMEPNPGAAVMVLEKSKVVLSEDDLKKTGETIIGRKTLLNLTRGSIQAALVHPKDGGVDFKIKTPECVAAARGTTFWVKRHVDPRRKVEATTIVVGQSVVRVTWVKKGNKLYIDVQAGQQLTVYSTGDSKLEAALLADLNSLQHFTEYAAFVFDQGPLVGQPGFANPLNGGPDTAQGDPGIAGVPAAQGIIGTSGNTITLTSGTTPQLTFPLNESQTTNR